MLLTVDTFIHKLTSLNDYVLLSYHNDNYSYHVLTRGHILNHKQTLRLDMARHNVCNQVESVWNGFPEHVLLLLRIYCQRHIYAKKTFHPVSSLIGIYKPYII